ncbi:phage integrase N-terminal SAM-like domain-containing protein [candidate division KSB1 bacterium]|nr:phage integrase N-terminal SAM-like domain-containing protein [candidate division KSB1 bacterium]
MNPTHYQPPADKQQARESISARPTVGSPAQRPQSTQSLKQQPQSQRAQNKPPFQTRHRGAQSVTSAAPGQEPKLLDQVSEVLRTKHYSIRTEKAYIDWIYRFIMFHGKRHPREMGAPEISQFLTHLAVEKHVAPSTQNQALSAILFLYKEVLKIDLGHVDFTWAKKPEHLPVILSGNHYTQLDNRTQATAPYE